MVLISGCSARRQGLRSHLEDIHTGPLRFIKHDQTYNHRGDAHKKADYDLPEIDRALAHESEAEGLDDEYHGVESIDPTPVLRNHTQRVNHAAGVHPELHKEAEHDLEIAEACGDGGHHASDAEAQGGHLQQQHRQDDNAPSDGNVGTLQKIIDVKDKEQGHLHSKTDEIDEELRNRDDQARKVDFVEQRPVGTESGSRVGHTTAEVSPTHGPGQKEEDGGNFARRNARDPVEYESEHQTGEKGLDDIPGGAEHGLLVARDKIPLHQAHDELPILPNFAERNMQELVLGRYNSYPFAVFGGGSHLIKSCRSMDVRELAT